MDDLRLVGWEVSTLLEQLASKIQALDFSATSGRGLESQSKCPRVSWETKVPSIWKATSPKIPQGSTGLEPQRRCYRVSWEMEVWEPLWWWSTFPNRPQSHSGLKCEVKALALTK